jgi:hydrogenase/urease accessory protein HupE
MKIATIVFTTSVLILFLVLSLKNQYTAILPIGFLYLIGAISLFLCNYIGQDLMKISLNIIYPIGFVCSLVVLIASLTWFTGNTFIETVKAAFLNRKDFISMTDPYIIANVVTYLLLLKRVLLPN